MPEDTSDAAVLAKIRKMVSAPPQNSRVITFTPQVAEQVLIDYNHHNRPKKPNHIKQYAYDMTTGYWGLTGDTIKFSDKGILRDGQNRLMAGVQSKTPFTTHVVFGVDDTLFDVMDRGKNRGSSDVFAIAGYTDTNNLSAAINWLVRFDTDTGKSRQAMEPRVALDELIKTYPDLPSFLPKGREIHRFNPEMPTGMATGLIYMATKIDPVKGTQFADAWAAGNYTGKFKALGHMVGKINQLKQLSQGRVHDTVRAALCVTAWKLVLAGRAGAARDFDWNMGLDFPSMRP
jgi:hypothetical protein